MAIAALQKTCQPSIGMTVAALQQTCQVEPSAQSMPGMTVADAAIGRFVAFSRERLDRTVQPRDPGIGRDAASNHGKGRAAEKGG